MLIVQKYGGTSLGDVDRIQTAAQRIAALAHQGTQVVVVVSAQGDTTDDMIKKAVQVNRRGSSREMDAYLAAGEQMRAWVPCSEPDRLAGRHPDRLRARKRKNQGGGNRTHFAGIGGRKCGGRGGISGNCRK